MIRLKKTSELVHRTTVLVTIVTALIFSTHARAQFMERTPERILPKVEFLGWNYDQLGYALSPGEKLELMFRNNSDQQQNFPVKWTLKNYVGKSITSGESQLSLLPGETGSVLVAVPADLADGHYNILYTPEAEGWRGTHPFYFDFRKPIKDEGLNMHVVAFLENMDSEGWARMMTGPFENYINIKTRFPDDLRSVDAVLVIAEALNFFNPEFRKLQDYVRMGGTAIVFGKTAPVLFEMMPVVGSDKSPEKAEPLSLKPLDGGPWQNFNPGEDYLHYPLRVTAKRGAKVLAEWSDGSPAIVSGAFGQGKVIYISTGSFQVWQDNPDLLGSDELALRLLYNEKGGAEAVNAMLSYADKIYQEDQKERLAVRDRVFEGLKIKKPENFMVISNDNMGRFGWLTTDGGLTENIEGKCRITPVRTQDTYTTIPYHVFDFNFSIGNETSPDPITVKQNWFAKTINWEYPNGEILTSTLSLGTPAILFEGKIRDISITGSKFTHVAYPVKGGMKVIKEGEKVNTSEMSENWLITFMAIDSIRDMPQLIVLTRRPLSAHFDNGLKFSFPEGGFGAMFTSRLYGVQRLAKGATIEWTRGIPADAINNASRWSKTFLNFPINCEEIGWIEADKVKFLDKFYFRNFTTDWKTKAITTTVIPPIYILANNVGTPVEFPKNLTDLNCPTKYGPLKGVNGNSTLISLDMPHTDHRAIVPDDELMVLKEMINRNVNGIDPGSLTYNDQSFNHQDGEFIGDLYPYVISHEVPYYEAPQIDLYKWWLVFNAILTRPVYTDSVRTVVDEHFKMRYWETMNYYPHKSLLIRKREPFTSIDYMTTFIWPTDSQNGWRYIGDIQESSAVDAYCYTNYARYYGDWTSLKANWNLCRELHDFLPKSMDWAVLAAGAREYWNATGIDMTNSEPYGRLAFAYASEVAGYPQDALRGKIGGARSMVTAVARLGMDSYIQSITSEGDPWREFKAFNFFNEFGMQLTKTKSGGITWLDTSKGLMHELALAYKIWAAEAMNNEQREIAKSSQGGALVDITQRLFLGWDRDSLLSTVKDNPRYMRENPTRFTDAKDLYDMAVLCMGNEPVFLSDWAPAEYVSGDYDAKAKEMTLAFQSHLGDNYTVKIYSHYKPVDVRLNDNIRHESWSYNPKTGWLEVNMTGSEQQRLFIKFGEAVAPLHPYFSGIN